jgi:hypothetical protein
VIDLFKAGLSSSNFLFCIFGGTEKLKKLRQVALIVAQRVSTHVSFKAQMIEKLGEMIG